MPEITFSKSAVKDVLKAFNKETDNEGFIVDEEGDRVLTPTGEEIKAKELGGISKGSEVFISDNFVSILDYIKSRDE